MTKSALWRRLDTPGHDAARVSPAADGWRLEGMAVFGHELGPARVEYRVDCAPDWTTRRARVSGWVGDRRCDVDVSRSEAGEWRLNGEAVGGLEQCLDVDFGFTPATNYLQLQRAGLEAGDTAAFPVAWLDVPDSTLIALPQRYDRRTASAFWYESPQGPYEAMLEIADSGFVRSYPGLWAMEE